MQGYLISGIISNRKMNKSFWAGKGKKRWKERRKASKEKDERKKGKDLVVELFLSLFYIEDRH